MISEVRLERLTDNMALLLFLGLNDFAHLNLIDVLSEKIKLNNFVVGWHDSIAERLNVPFLFLLGAIGARNCRLILRINNHILRINNLIFNLVSNPIGAYVPHL